MRSLLLAIAVLVALVAGCGMANETDRANEASFKNYGFPIALGLTHLCGQSVRGTSGEAIVWDAFASRSSPSALVDDYRQKLGDAGLQREPNGGGTWRLPPEAPQPTRILEIMPTDADGPHRSCQRKPRSDERSIILLSQRR